MYLTLNKLLTYLLLTILYTLYLSSFCAHMRGQQEGAGMGGVPWVCTS